MRVHDRRIRTSFSAIAVSACMLASGGGPFGQDSRNVPAQLAARILDDTGVTGGLVVHVGCGDGQLTAALAGDRRSLLVHGLDVSEEAVAKARARIRGLGSYGVVAIDTFDGARLPYIDNLVNLLVTEDIGRLPLEEIDRVLAPGGVSYVRRGEEWTKRVKPRPDAIDEWTHYLYDASNNAVARDRVVGPPRRLQWTAGPRYSRHHDKMSSMSAMVSAGGRVFYIFDEAPRVSILFPPEWNLIARDAFNGTLLWKRPIEKWHTHLWPLKNGPAQLPRRLVASGDRVYVTLRIDGPVLALDASTGATLRTYAGSENAEEIVLVDDVLLVVAGQPREEEATRARRRGEPWNADDWRVTALRASSGEVLWTVKTPALPNTLAADSSRVVFHDGERVVCLRRDTGRPLWRSEPVARSEQIRSFYSPTLVIYRGIVLFSGGETAGSQTGSWYREGEDTMTAVDAETGRILWTAPHPPSGYRSAEDLLVADGLVWTGETTSGRAEGLFTGRDPSTGKVVREFVPDVDTYWFHHRCYRGKGTDKFLLMSRTGVEFVDVREQHWETNHFVRGACLYGVMPANGLLYAPQHPCACYLEAKLSGFNALAPALARPLPPVSSGERLTKGPAFGAAHAADDAPSTGDWPTFRHDAARSGRASTLAPSHLERAWKTPIGGRLSSPVISGGKVFVAAVDEHTVHALDAASGRKLWAFTAGGRVDSPPTIYGGSVYFGSADGRIYCLRASDGALAWRYLAAAADRRMVSFDQLESVWPLHGSVLIQDDQLYAVAGRSMFLDGGLRLLRLEPRYGKLLSEHILNDRDEETGKDLQEFVSWLNMPTGLPDVLSSDAKYIYMRSQPFELDGRRLPLKEMPRAADADQGAPEPVQGTEHAHIFCPTGFLDDSWWHRSYWMYGTMYVSGWQGYYLAGKSAPAGRILVSDETSVYGFGRKPKYWRWTTPIEHQLFAAPKDQGAPTSPFASERRKTGVAAGTRVRVAKSASLNAAGREVTVAAWVRSSGKDGVVLARGGASHGWALHVRQGLPVFAARVNEELSSVAGETALTARWTHLAAVLSKAGEMRLYVDGRLAGSRAASLLAADPAEAMEIGSDEGSAVGEYGSSTGFTGLIDEVRVYHRALSPDEIRDIADVATDPADLDRTELVLYYSFEDGEARDGGAARIDGVVEGATAAQGRIGEALRFTGGGGGGVPGFQVRYAWTADLPFYARAMVLAGDTIFVAGPADLVDEEAASRRIDAPEHQEKIREQQAVWAGEKGAPLWAVSAGDGTKRSELHLDSPPVFNGLAAAGGQLYVTAMDGSVVCLGEADSPR